MKSIVIKDIDYGLSFYYSYSLPLYAFKRSNGTLVLQKKHGVCKGLICKSSRSQTICYIPDITCQLYVEKLLGLDTQPLVRKLCKMLEIETGYSYSILHRFAFVHDPYDKIEIFLSVFLSRNTDYYVNTVKWVRNIMETRLFSEGMKSLNISSYQFQQLLGIINNVSDIFRSYNDPLGIALKLLKLPNVGPKTVFAFLLHSFGLTQYAPIDRYYRSFLSLIGVKGKDPNKKYCLSSRLDCSKCAYSSKCVYSLAMNKFHEFNGIIQSLTYIYGRLKSTRLRSPLEKILIDKNTYRILVELKRLLESIGEISIV